jgi:hypothetical protein
MDKDGQPVNKVPITFHKKTGPTTGPGGSVILLNAGWWWGNAVITDGYTHEVYTTFHRNGMVRLQRIDLETGQLSAGTELPFPFPEKIEIYKREAFFLIKSDGSTDNWKIVRCKL